MDERILRLECLKLADGDLDKARMFFDFVMSAKPLQAQVRPFIGGGAAILGT